MTSKDREFIIDFLAALADLRVLLIQWEEDPAMLERLALALRRVERKIHGSRKHLLRATRKAS